LLVKYLEDETVKYIEKPLDFNIKSVKIEGQEVLRIIDCDDKKITLFSFLHDGRVIE
jgi:hypothetical protein